MLPGVGRNASSSRRSHARISARNSRGPGARQSHENLKDIDRNSTMLVREQKQTGRTETQSFKIQKSKPILDEIDRVLARHYELTDEELDIVLNYDIKYRL